MKDTRVAGPSDSLRAADLTVVARELCQEFPASDTPRWELVSRVFGSRERPETRKTSVITWPLWQVTVKLADVVSLRLRSGKFSTTALACSSLLLALGLTALSDTQAQAQRGDISVPTRLKKAAATSEMRILDWSLWYVAKYYVEPDLTDPHRLTLAAHQRLDRSITAGLGEPL